jgi:hypothetical protein
MIYEYEIISSAKKIGGDRDMIKAELQKQWASKITEFRKSGQKLSKWCAVNNIRPRAMTYWLKKGMEETKSIEEQTRWLPLEMDSSGIKAQDTLTVKVGFASVEIKAGFDQKLLLDVLKTVRALC